MMTIVLPTAVAAIVAFLVAISPITTAISTFNAAINTGNAVVTTGEKVAADIKADVAKWKLKHKKPKAPQKAAP